LFDSEESLTCDEWKSFCLTSLTRADIDCFHYQFPLKAVHNVHSLRLEIDQVCLWYYLRKKWFICIFTLISNNLSFYIFQVHYLNDLIPTFHNLTKLELISLDYGWQFLIKVLNHCPKLQELNIDQVCLGSYLIYLFIEYSLNLVWV
jgi:hypothetical protein